MVDRYAANFAAERALQREDMSWGKFTQKCEIHIVHQSNSYAMNLCKNDISGLLSLALSQYGSGVLRTLRDLLASVLEDHLHVCSDDPPKGKVEAHREETYRLFLPLPTNVRDVGATTSQVVQRRYVLSTMLNGDLTDEEYVYHFCPYGCCADETETRFKMSMFVCWALIPSKTPKFARNRWVNQEPAVDWAGLLSRHHNLLSKLMIKWIGPPVSNVVVPTFEPLQDDIYGGYLALPSCESMPSAGAVPIQLEEDPEELNDFTEAPAEEDGADRAVTRNNQPEHAVLFS